MLKQFMTSSYLSENISSRTIDSCLSILETAPSLSPEFPDIHVALGMIDGLCNAPMPLDVTDKFLNTILADGRLQRLRHSLAEAEHCNERTQARSALKAASLDDWLSPDTAYRYEKMIGIELALLKEACTNRIPQRCVFVGCGALPLTAVFISKMAGAVVTGIDNHAGCVELGGRVLSKFFPEQKVDLVHAAGENYDFSRADLVYVAAMVPNKCEVFRQISETNPIAICVTRGGTGLRQVFYEPVDMGGLLSSNWNCRAIQPPIYPIRNASYIFDQINR